ncbi:MAG: hypothetical protein JW729_10375 [Bacteroidales bacterium]|nr:hypothetical protein [Bacteroidales bacterium]
MNTNYLLPHSFKKIGWILFIPSFIFGILYLIFDLEPAFLDCKVIAFFNDEILEDLTFVSITENNLLNEIIGILIIVSASFIVFAKEKKEDEFITRIRL